jgi:hypothetical protein
MAENTKLFYSSLNITAVMPCPTKSYFNFAILYYCKMHLKLSCPSCTMLDYCKLCTFWYGFLDVMEYGVIIEWNSCILSHFLLQNIKPLLWTIRAIDKTYKWKTCVLYWLCLYVNPYCSLTKGFCLNNMDSLYPYISVICNLPLSMT